MSTKARYWCLAAQQVKSGPRDGAKKNANPEGRTRNSKLSPFPEEVTWFRQDPVSGASSLRAVEESGTGVPAHLGYEVLCPKLPRLAFTPQRKAPLIRFDAALRVSIPVSVPNQQTLTASRLFVAFLPFTHGCKAFLNTGPRRRPESARARYAVSPSRLYAVQESVPVTRCRSPLAVSQGPGSRGLLLLQSGAPEGTLAFLVVGSPEVSPHPSLSRASPRVPP